MLPPELNVSDQNVWQDIGFPTFYDTDQKDPQSKSGIYQHYHSS